jgi:hypothetical protein
MTIKHGEHYDYNVRQWVLDSAINTNKKGAKAEKIISDARKFYGFVFPSNGKIETIKDKDG